MQDIHEVPGSKCRIWIIPVHSIGAKKSVMDYELRAKGPGQNLVLFRVCFSPYRGGWYYFSTSQNPGKVTNSLSAPTDRDTAIKNALELSKALVTIHFQDGAA